MHAAHTTPTQVSAMSPATRAWLREVRTDRAVLCLAASCVLSGALIAVGNVVVRLLAL